MPGRAQSSTSSLKQFKRNSQANQTKSGECGQTGKFCHFLFSTAQPIGGTPPKVVGPPPLTSGEDACGETGEGPEAVRMVKAWGVWKMKSHEGSWAGSVW